MAKTVILVCFITGILYPQTFQLGFRSESTWYNATDGNEFVPLYHFFITAGLYEDSVTLLSDLTEELRFGRILAPDDMIGNDLALSLKSQVIKISKPDLSYYLSLGIDMHFNIGDHYSHGPWTLYNKTFYLLMFGIGFTMDKHVFVEVSKYIPISNSILGEDDSYNFNPYYLKRFWKLNSLIAINFGLNIDVLHFK